MFGQTFKYFATNVRAGTACFGEEFGIGWYCLHMARYWLVLKEHISWGLKWPLGKVCPPLVYIFLSGGKVQYPQGLCCRALFSR